MNTASAAVNDNYKFVATHYVVGDIWYTVYLYGKT